jgi:hypothetical protein
MQVLKKMETISSSTYPSLVIPWRKAMMCCLLVGLVGLSGCSNPCEEFAQRMCDKAGSDKLACETQWVPTDDPNKMEKTHARCERIKDVVVSCAELKEVARHASDEDRLACKQNLEFIRALEKQTE